MAGLDHITGFSYRSHVSVEGRSPGDYALKAAGQPRRFPVHRKTSDQRRKDPSEDSDSTEDERVWRDVMFGTCKQGSEVDEVLDYMDRQRDVLSRYSSSSTVADCTINSEPFHGLANPVATTSFPPPSATDDSPPNLATADTLDTLYWAHRPRVPPCTPLPAWVDSCGNAPSLDDLCAEYLDIARLADDATTHAEDGYTYDRHDFFYTPSPPSNPRPALPVECVDTPLQYAHNQDSGSEGSKSACHYAQPGMSAYETFCTPHSAVPSLMMDTGSTAYSTTLCTPPLSLAYTPRAMSAGKPLPLPPAFSGTDLDDDPFYIGLASPRSSGLDKSKGQGKSISPSLSPAAQTRHALFHHTAPPPLLASLSFPSANPGYFIAPQHVNSLPPPDLTTAYLSPSALSPPPTKVAYGTIDPKHTSSPTGSQLFRPSPSFGSYPAILPLQYGPSGEDKGKQTRSAPFSKRNLDDDAGKGHKVFVFEDQSLPVRTVPTTTDLADAAAAAPGGVQEAQSIVLSAGPSKLVQQKGGIRKKDTQSQRGKGKGMGKGKKKSRTAGLKAKQPSLQISDTLRRPPSRYERGYTPTLFATHPLSDPYGTGMDIDDKRGILEQLNANSQPSSSSICRSPTPSHPASMSFLSPDNTPTKKEKSALRAMTKRILDMTEPRVSSPCEGRKGRKGRVGWSSPVPTDRSDDECTDTEEVSGVGHGQNAAKLREARAEELRVRGASGGKGRFQSSDRSGSAVLSSHGSNTTLDFLNAPNEPTARNTGRALKKKGSFVAPLPLRASTSASSIGLSAENQRSNVSSRTPATSSGPYHKGPAEGLRRARSKTNFVPPASTRPSLVSASASTPSISSGKPPAPPKLLGKRKRGPGSQISAPAPRASPDMPTPPSSPFQRPLRVELEGSQSDLSDTSDEGHSSDLDAEGEDEEDEVMTSDQTDTDDQDEEYQERATSSSRQAGKAAAAAKPKRQTKIKASKKRSGQYKRHLAEKRVQMGEGSIQAHTGRGYTETELKLMLPFWDGQSVLSIETLTDVQKTLKANGFKHREPPALKWYMKNTLHQRILDYAKANPRKNPLPKSTRARTSV